MTFGFLIYLGIFLILSGSLLIMLTFFQKKEEDTDHEEQQKYTEIKGGGVIMIGPIPIVFGSDYKYALFAIILTIILMVLAIKYL